METRILDKPTGQEFFEAKYCVPKPLRLQLLSRLRHSAEVPQKFANAFLKTYYFDDRSDANYFDSRDGQLIKKKYRLREYINPEAGGAFYSIEIKKKYESAVSKVKQLIYRKPPSGFEFTTFRELLDKLENLEGLSLSAHRQELPPQELFLNTVIYYERYRFDDKREEGVRYNLDTNIVVYRVLNSKLYEDQCLRASHDVFEIKGRKAEHFPHFLRDFQMHPSSFSKYVWGTERFF